MADPEDHDQVEQIVRSAVDPTVHELAIGSTWLAIRPVTSLLPPHGWKLHISSRAIDFPTLVRDVLPLLLEAGVHFKLARSMRVLAELNDGQSSPATVGKAFTIYPERGRLVRLGRSLAVRLRGRPGPRVLSDRRVLPNSPVYYRYGPFSSTTRRVTRGEVVEVLIGPNGEEFEATATLSYRQPPWTTDPFEGREIDRPTTLADHYRIVGGIRESAVGNVYRATDLRDGTSVVVKQARALVQEAADATDTRLRLRNERRVLTKLDGIAGVPRFVDHFGYGADEFLVTTDAGEFTLEADVAERGLYSIEPDPDGRDLVTLGGRLARVLADVHRRGVVLHDLAPKNIVVDDDRVTLIDFGIAAADDVRLNGFTPGYAPARQQRAEPPRVGDDLHALGMTLWHAHTRSHPIIGSDFADLPRIRTLQQIRRTYGPNPTGVVGLIVDLLSADEASTVRAAGRLANGSIPTTGPSLALPDPPVASADTVTALTDAVLAELLRRTDELLGVEPGPFEPGLYTGWAGIGSELTHHRDHPGVAERLETLIHRAERDLPHVSPGPGLYVGRDGVELFLHQVERGRPDPDDEAEAEEPEKPDDWPDGADLMTGAAGVGLGRLALYRATGDADHLRAAARYTDRLLGRGGTTGEKPDVASSEPPSMTPVEVPIEPELAAIDPTIGRAHGEAGVLGLLLDYVHTTGDTELREEAADRTRRLIDRTELLLEQSTSRTALPTCVSWCQGLVGIAMALLRAASVLDDDVALRLAERAGERCAAWVPHLVNLGRCCGVCGSGDLFIELAVATEDDRWWDAAHDVAAHLLVRSPGTLHRPRFFDDRRAAEAVSWAQGLTGVLGFLRRLRDHGGESPIGGPTR